MVVTRLMASRRAREGREDGLSPTRNVEAMIRRTSPHLLNECKRKHLNMEVSRNVEEMTRRTPPHLLNEHNRKPFNMIESMNVDAMNRRTPPHLLNQHNKKPFSMTKSMNVDSMTRRAPPHLLNKHNRGHFNTKESAFTSHAIGSSSINHTRTSNGNYAHFGFRPISIGGSSSLPQNHSMYTGIVPGEGQTQGYLYLPALLSAIPNASATSSSLHKEGTPLANDNPSEHLRSSLGGNKFGGSSSRSAEYQLPHQFSRFYPVLHTNGNNNWNHSQNQQLPQYHYYQLGREEQLPLPSYWSSQNTSDISNSACARATSSSVLGKRPAASSNPAHSFFQPPPPLPLLDADDMEPQCRLETDELLSLMQSLGTPEFLSNAEKVLRSGSSLYEPHHAAPANVTTGNSRAASAPSLVLGMGNGGAGDKGKGKQVCSYWDLSDMVEMMESMKKKKRLETSQSLPKLTLGSDGQGCSKDTMQRRTWN